MAGAAQGLAMGIVRTLSLLTRVCQIEATSLQVLYVLYVLYVLPTLFVLVKEGVLRLALV